MEQPSNDDELNSLLDEFSAPPIAEESVKDPVKAAEEEGNSFWDTVLNLSPTAVVDPGTPAGKITQQAGIGLMKVAEGAANTVIDGLDSAENWMAEQGFGDGDFINEDSQIKALDRIYGKPTNTAEKAGRFIGQYVMSFGAIGIASKGSTLARMGKGIAGASVLSAAAIDPEEKRLSDLIETYPGLSNPISQLLATDPEDSRLMSRFKNLVESVVVDMLLIGGGKLGIKAAQKLSKAFGDSVVSVKQAKNVHKKVKAESAVDKEALKDAKSAKLAADNLKIDQDKVNKAIKEIQPEGKSVREIMDIAKKEKRSLTDAELHAIAKRGKISDKQAGINSQKIIDSRGKTEELIKRKLPGLINQEELLAVRNNLESAAAEFQASIPKNIDNATEAEMATFLVARDRVSEVHASLEAGVSEVARTLRTKRIIEEGSEVNMKALNEFIKLQGGDEGIKESMRLYNQALDHANVLELNEHLLKNFEKKKSGALYEYWINNILSGLNTHLVNVASNTISTTSSLIESAIVEGMGKFGSAEAHTAGQTHAMLSGMIEGVFEGLSNAKAVMKGTMPESAIKIPDLKTSSIVPETFGLDPETIYGEMVTQLGKVINIPGKALVAEDTFFRSVNYRARVHQLASRRIMEQGLKKGTKEYKSAYTKLVKDPPKELSFAANRFADENVFTRDLDSKLFIGEAQASAEIFLRKIPIARIAAPFMRISGNLTDYTLQRVPGMGALAPKFRADWAAGGVRKQEAIAKMTVGSGIMLAGSGLSYNGTLIGSGPADRKFKKAIDFKEDTLSGIPLRHFGPYGSVLKLSADISELAGKIDVDQEGAMGDLTFAALGIMSEVLVPATMGENLPGFFSLISDVSSGKVNQEGVSKGIARFAGGLVPFSSFLRQSGRVLKDTKIDKGPEEIYDFYEETWSRIKNEWLDTVDIFGMGNMPPQRNMFGEEVFYPPGLGGGIASAIFGHSEATPLEDELVRLEMAGKILANSGDETNKHLRLTMPNRTIRQGMGGENYAVKLSPKEYDRYVQLSGGIGLGGPTLREALSTIMKDSRYKKMGDEMKKIRIKDTVKMYRSMARERMKGDQDIQTRFRSKTKARLEGMRIK